MGIREEVAKIRSALPEAEASKINTSLIEVVAATKVLDIRLEESTAEVNTLSAQLREKNDENKTRRLKTEENDAAILKLNTELTTAKSTIETNNKKLSAYADVDKQNFISNFKTIVEHPNFKTVETEFTLPEKNTEGEYDFSKLTSDEVAENVSKLNYFNKIKHFAIEDAPPTNTNVFGGRFNQTTDKDKPITNADEEIAAMREVVKQL